MTCLPLPSGSVIGDDISKGEKLEVDELAESSHQHIHSLESAIINWTKQIKNVLKQDPEGILVSTFHQSHPSLYLLLLLFFFFSLFFFVFFSLVLALNQTHIQILYTYYNKHTQEYYCLRIILDP